MRPATRTASRRRSRRPAAAATAIATRANSACTATFSKAAREAGKAAEEYSLDKGNAATLFEITATHGKVIEGRFEFHMSNKAGHALLVSSGAIVVEDRQL